MQKLLQFLGCLLIFVSATVDAKDDTVVLDSFDTAKPWRVIASTQVSGSIRSAKDQKGRSLCLDYNFNGVSGYVGIQRDLKIDYPENYRFDFELRGDSPDNDLQFKLIDASGDNVWWVNRPKYRYPSTWAQVRYKQRQIGKAWGPGLDPVLRNSAKIEFTINNSVGGKGAVCFDTLTFTPLPVDDGSPLKAVAIGRNTALGSAAENAVDGDPKTVWRSLPTAELSEATARSSTGMWSIWGPNITLDLKQIREFGGVVLQWGEHPATAYEILASNDGTQWRTLRRVENGNGGRDDVALPETEARYLQILPEQGPGFDFTLAEIAIQPLAYAATPNDFIASVAKSSPRGHFPRGFSGEQAYWTIVGVDGGTEQGLIGEDGAIEVAKGGFTIEPFVRVDGTWLTWADVTASQSLQDGYLPIPSVEWAHSNASLRVSAFVDGTSVDGKSVDDTSVDDASAIIKPTNSRPADSKLRNSQLIARYVLRNPSATARDYTLALAIQPFQVNPPSQMLNTIGGVSRIESLAIEHTAQSGIVRVNGRPRVFAQSVHDAAFTTPFDGGMAISHLAANQWPDRAKVEDPTGLASGAMLYRMRLAPGESHEVALVVPMTGDAVCEGNACNPTQRQQAVAEQWRSQLDDVRIDVPEAGKPLADSVRTALAHMLISRIGPRLQPGTRSYARSWIRDGAMISEGLLRLGQPQPVRDYLQWYAPYQFENGKVPCCVDDRGSDPVPENDSHGELIFTIAEYVRYTGDDAFLATMWPHVRGAFNYMETLRASERTEANRTIDPAFYGMMPASISHEGYSAKPMHSYWDNFWALRGYKDAVWIAERLGRQEDIARMRAARDQFRDDLQDSLRHATARHRIDYLPGAAELGDFDPTSTTIALAPVGEQHWLPAPLLNGTFERYWREFVQRRDGLREWKDYTPYEWRNVGAFVRLGWRERAWEAARFFFDDRAPPAWNQWGEVVSRTPRKPFFLGDLPHAWVASDFVRSALDMFAYSREADDSIVLAAGIPSEWFDAGVAIDGLHFPQGRLRYSLRRDGERLRLELGEGTALPAGGAVLSWPYRDRQPGRTTIDGAPATWREDELRIEQAPAKVVVEIR
jgi:hypothetical protein